jgi:hypothetical protein
MPINHRRLTASTLHPPFKLYLIFTAVIIGLASQYKKLGQLFQSGDADWKSLKKSEKIYFITLLNQAPHTHAKKHYPFYFIYSRSHQLSKP